MEFLQYAAALLVTLGVLVTLHEYGHFWVARRCGVQVKRFSVGFGKPIYTWYDRHGTEFAIAVVPLGGYVKMLDEREGDVSADQLDSAFNRKPVRQRMAIAAAGPVANLLFAVLVFWVIQVSGIEVLAPVVGQVPSGSPAAEAGLQRGDEILAVDGREVSSWSDINMQLVSRLGHTGVIELQVRPAGSSDGLTRSVPISNWLAGVDKPDLMAGLGLQIWRPHTPPLLAEVLENSPAETAGLQSGDLILSVSGEEVTSWQTLVEIIQDSVGVALDLEYQRNGGRYSTVLVPAPRSAEDNSGFIGVQVQQPEWPEHMKRHLQKDVLSAIPAAITQTLDTSVLYLHSLGKMLIGVISVENLGGPITIAKAAGDSAHYGFQSFLFFLAKLSIMLGILNLLPIPMLDGGHLLFYSIEALRGRPLSDANQLFALKIGMALLAGIMMVAIFNDFTRL